MPTASVVACSTSLCTIATCTRAIRTSSARNIVPAGSRATATGNSIVSSTWPASRRLSGSIPSPVTDNMEVKRPAPAS